MPGKGINEASFGALRWTSLFGFVQSLIYFAREREEDSDGFFYLSLKTSDN